MPLLWKHALDFLVAQPDLVNWISLSFKRFKVALDVGRKEDLWVPIESLGRSYAGDQPGGSIRVSDVDDGMLLL